MILTLRTQEKKQEHGINRHTYTLSFSTQGNKARSSYLRILHTGQAQLLKKALKYPLKSIIYIYSSSRPLRSNIKKLQFPLTLSLPFHLQTLRPSWHISVHGGSSWGWWLFLIHLQGVCSSVMLLEILHRKPVLPHLFSFHTLLFSCFLTKQQKWLHGWKGWLPPHYCGFHLRLPLIHTKIGANACFAARGSDWAIIPTVWSVFSCTPERVLTWWDLSAMKYMQIHQGKNSRKQPWQRYSCLSRLEVNGMTFNSCLSHLFRQRTQCLDSVGIQMKKVSCSVLRSGRR